MPSKRPSDGWAGFNGLEPGPGSRHDRIRTVLSTINLQRLEEVARLAPFSDEVYWIAKIQHVHVNSSEADENRMDLLSEIATMRTVRARTSIPVPQVFAHDVSASNEVRYPYVLMEYMDGRVLKSPIASAVPSEFLSKVAKQLAEVLFELHGLAFDKFGQLWCGESCDEPPEIIPDSDFNAHTSLEWFYRERQSENAQILILQPQDPGWRTACWVLKIAVPHIIMEPRLHGPFPICHVDLHFGNLLFDDDYNLKGVIDWDRAQTVPIERFVTSQEFMTFPSGSEEVNNKILTLRSLVREHLRHLEETRSPEGKLPTPLLSQVSGPTLLVGRLVAGLIYGDHVSWEQLVRVYGTLDLY
ncbi:hypothetical protein N656DRAFT_789436 [Canariomyces notabilis]|uniref:Aminoglycoside phosphotransferase domain-containing protein n=1 Tax=Canariomyces notabilis TaxID=2074819 RepID=A0AAN6TE97_9PEZI|nr:hypothetical protein N656DRAFT_789436 [Canariomyces arenarius]